MSDSVEDLARRYVHDVNAEQHPRSIGLFPIPEYPELERERGMWTAALDAILTTLRYLAPATLLTLFWGQQSFLFTLLRHIDNAFRAIVFSSEEQKQSVLKWLAEAGTVQVEHLDTVWRHGWVLCGVLDSYLPGACAGHPPTRLSLKHAQAIADHYLGVEPVFSRQELESNDSLSRHQEWRLATYLDRVREALSKITPPVSKPTSQRTSPETTQFTLDYVAKGSGLTAAQVNNKMSFKIYPTAQQALDPGEVTILIRGPKDTYGMTVLPPILGKAQKIRQKLLGLQSKQTFTENALPITQGATYLRSYGKNDMNKTYFIPKTVYAIDIEAIKREDHTKILYSVPLEGKYEVSITSRGQNIMGSPFLVTTSYNIIGILEKENFCLEDGEEIDIVDVKSDRKVVLRIVDFVTEKMLLRENGVLEKITEDEAKLLMSTDVEHERSSSVTEVVDHLATETVETKSDKFNKVANKVLKMNRVCKAFEITNDKNENLLQKQDNSRKENTFICTRSHNDIPDIVNSTLGEGNVSAYIILPEKRDKYIVPENISVSIRTEKAKPVYEEEVCIPALETEMVTKLHDHNITTCSPESLEKILEEEQPEDDNISVDRMTPLSSNNPFLTDGSEDFTVEKKLGTFVKTEYERNNSQGEETRNSAIKIIVDKNDTPSPLPTTNPFIETDARHLERPKTPVYKIITGDLTDRIDSPYLDPKNGLLSEEMLGNEFVNPFFMHQMQSTHHYEQPPMADFIIGAPVSLPPIIRAPSPEPTMEALVTKRRNLNFELKHDDKVEEEITPSVFSTPLHTLSKNKDQTTITSTFHSLDSSLSDPIDNSNASTSSDNQYAPYRIDTSNTSRDVSPRKDTWDSAYVSIDDTTASPDNNNNENTVPDTPNKQKFSLCDDTYEQELSNMGPAEKELWEMCGELNDAHRTQEEARSYRWEIKRPLFTPIIEESDRSISSGLKESLKNHEADPVTVAFAELNEVYQEYFPNLENSSTMTSDDCNLRNTEVEHVIETRDMGVESASEVSDVIRHNPEQEGMISEVQTNVTESVSASQALRDKTSEQYHTLPSHNRDEKHFGEKSRNIVLEKKKYWDEKIRQIEAKTEETTKHHKKKRISSKPLKHDSLSKRKGKQIVKNFLNAGNENQIQITKQSNIYKPEVAIKEPASNLVVNERCEAKLVEKWKKYWDEKLVTESDDLESDLRTKSPICQSKSPQRYKEKPVQNTSSANDDNNLEPVKQELPEEVFKAFETSPKRFFGTSRKHILNKIDTFIGKPSSSEENSPTEEVKVSLDSGLVSSRISLFHNLTNTEPLPWMQRKSQSMHNIYQRKESDKNITIVERLETRPSHDEIEEKTNPVAVTKSLASTPEKVSVKDKRARLVQSSFNKSFDETEIQKPINKETRNIIKPNVHKTIKEPNRPTHIDKYKKNNVLRKTSISKSEMDLFSKLPVETDDGLDKHKSYDELPKINVKNFISLYENVSKPSEERKTVKRIYRPSSVDSQNHWQPISVNSDAEKKTGDASYVTTERRSRSRTATPEVHPRLYSRSSKISESTSVESFDVKTDNESLDLDIASKEKETTYISLSDIELEIVEDSPDKSEESTPDNIGQPHIDYKNRFKQAKQFFQSLEELREDKKPRKLNECEMLLLTNSSESLEQEKPQKKLKKIKKSHSMPSSELAKYWTQMQEDQKGEPKESKLVKISEKFQVEDLFTDVMEGRLSRQGSLRGIPHKKAVLEAFRSMENISDSKLSAYEVDTSQMSDFSNEALGRSAQTYLREYPYLPTTDPSKFHSRLDAKASGLITLKELLEKKGRRNSVPDLRLNATFSADL